MISPAADPIIYLITEGEALASNFHEKKCEILDIIRFAVEERVSYIQIREKELSARHLLEITTEAATITRGSATRLLVNDRADIALAAGADGVHLPANSLPAVVIRDHFPKDFIIGVSTHSVEDAMKASLDDGANFAVYGPVFESPGKRTSQGITKLFEVCEKVRPLPVLALGGIDEKNVSSVLEVGAAGFTAIRSLNDAGSMRSICRRFRQ